jgi:hypothetical protein
MTEDAMKAFARSEARQELSSGNGLLGKAAQAFSKAAARRLGSSGNEFLDAILRERKDLRKKQKQGKLMVYYPQQGMAGHTIIIGNEVFKGPRSAERVEKFDDELHNLKDIEGKGLPVPRVTCVGKKSVFYGMTRMDGVELGHDVEGSLTPAQQRLLARDIADFIINLAEALPPHGKLFAMHWDLKGENILIDPETKRLTGIVDFGNINYSEKENLTDGFWVPGDRGTMPRHFMSMLHEEYNLRKAELSDSPAPQKSFRRRGLRSIFKHP